MHKMKAVRHFHTPEVILSSQNFEEMENTIQFLQNKLREALLSQEKVRAFGANALRMKEDLVDSLKNENEGLIRSRLEELRMQKEQNAELKSKVRKLEEHIQRVEQSLARTPRTEDIGNLNGIIEGLLNQINEKDAIIGDIKKERDTARQNLQEHIQWLQESKKRTIDVEEALCEKNILLKTLKSEIEELKTRMLEESHANKQEQAKMKIKLQELQGQLRQAEESLAQAPRAKDISNLSCIVESLRHEVHKKNVIIDGVKKERDDARWNLKEYKQRLEDAKKRNTDLQCKIDEMDQIINELLEEMQCLNITHHLRVLPDGTSYSENFEQMKNAIRELKNKLQDAERKIQGVHKQKEIMINDLENVMKRKNEALNALEDELNELRSRLHQKDQMTGKTPHEDDARKAGLEHASPTEEDTTESTQKRTKVSVPLLAHPLLL